MDFFGVVNANLTILLPMDIKFTIPALAPLLYCPPVAGTGGCILEQMWLLTWAKMGYQKFWRCNRDKKTGLLSLRLRDKISRLDRSTEVFTNLLYVCTTGGTRLKLQNSLLYSINLSLGVLESVRVLYDQLLRWPIRSQICGGVVRLSYFGWFILELQIPLYLSIGRYVQPCKAN